MLECKRSIARKCFVGVEQDAGDLRPGGMFGGVELGLRSQADFEQHGGICWIGGEVRGLGFEESLEGLRFFRFRITIEGELVGAF
jgi:hypothetical protein